MSNVTVTVDSDDQAVCREVGEMFRRLAGGTGCSTAKEDCNCYAEVDPDGPTSAAEVFGGLTCDTPAPPPLTAESIQANLTPEYNALPPVPPPVVAPQTPQPAPGTDLDTRGLPWDRRIHSSAKSKCADGTWKKLRNTDPALVAGVEAELLTALAVPTPPPAPGNLSVAGPGCNDPAINPTAMVPPAPPAPPVLGPAPATFAEFIQTVTAKCSAKLSTYDEVIAIVRKHYGPEAGIPTVQHRLDLIPAVYAELEALWASRT